MSDYKLLKGGKLSLKSQFEKKKKHKKNKRKKEESDTEKILNSTDTLRHGGWWSIFEISQISGNIVIEFDIKKFAYAEAQDDGLFKIGPSHEIGEEPNQEEILTAFIINDKKVSLKSGFGKYVGLEKTGIVSGRSDAVGSREQWEPIFQDGKLALMGSNNCFLSVNDDGFLQCINMVASDDQIIFIRTNNRLEKKMKTDIPLEELTTSLKDTEENYVKKYQSFQDHKLRINQTDRSDLEQAGNSGNLHEVLLDRREKMKSDKFCK